MERTRVYLFFGIFGLFLLFFTVKDIYYETLLNSNNSKLTFGVVINKSTVANSSTLSISYTINYLDKYTYYLTSECFDCNINVGDTLKLTYYTKNPEIVKYSGDKQLSVLNSLWFEIIINLILLFCLIKGLLLVRKEYCK